jgi:hypothetical protein
MARKSVDFSDVQGFEPLEKGEYAVMFEKLEMREAQEADKYDYINVELTVTEPGFEGRKLWMNWSFSPKALWRMKQSLENLGLPADQIDVEYDDDTMQVTTPELVGMPAIATVTQRVYQGQIQNDVGTLTAVESTGKKPASKAGGKPAAPRRTLK